MYPYSAFKVWQFLDSLHLQTWTVFNFSLLLSSPWCPSHPHPVPSAWPSLSLSFVQPAWSLCILEIHLMIIPLKLPSPLATQLTSSALLRHPLPSLALPLSLCYNYLCACPSPPLDWVPQSSLFILLIWCLRQCPVYHKYSIYFEWHNCSKIYFLVAC